MLSMHPQPTSEELKLFGTEFHLATLLQSAIQMRDTEGIMQHENGMAIGKMCVLDPVYPL